LPILEKESKLNNKEAKMKNKINEFLEENLIIILSLGLILVIVLSMPFLKEQPKKEKTQVLPTPKEQPSNAFPSPTLPMPPLSFSLLGNETLKENISFSLEVFPQEEISASVYRLEILFDPKVLEAEEVLAGSFFKNPQILRNEIDNQEGRIDFSVGINPQEKITTDEPKSKAPLLAITFRVKSLSIPEKLSSTTISFGEKTAVVSGEEEFKNLNQELKPIIIATKTAHE